MADALGAFEQAVLLAIVRLRKEAYGRAIHREVEERLGRSVAAGAVHATLQRLERKNLVTSELGEGTEIRAGRPRRFYSLQPSARLALNDARAHIEKLWNGFEWPLKGRI
jgi:DNA-binding PadR family transcriptional regulator